MSNFFSTESVDMFPSAYRVVSTKSKFTSEENFVNIINSIVDKDCYVLSLDDTDEGPILKVVLHGYYFEIKDFNLSENPDFYVAIKVEQGANAIVNFNNNSVANTQINNGNIVDTQIDVNGEFTGLAYSKTPFKEMDTNNYKYYKLQVSQGGSLINRVRLSSNSIYYKGDRTRSVSSLLDGKQDKLTAGNGINSSKLNNNEVALTDEFNNTLNSFFPSPRGVGSATQPVYVSTSGTMAALSSSSGMPQTSGSKNNVDYKYTQAALITQGHLMDSGVAFYASEGNPQQEVGKNGDFWFKYTN